MLQKQFITYILPKRVKAAANINYLEKLDKQYTKIGNGFAISSLALSGASCASVYGNHDLAPLVIVVNISSIVSGILVNSLLKDYQDSANIWKRFDSYLFNVQKIASRKELNELEILNLNSKFTEVILSAEELNAKVVPKTWKLNIIENVRELGWEEAENIIKNSVEEE